jgi:hypothetical protein
MHSLSLFLIHVSLHAVVVVEAFPNHGLYYAFLSRIKNSRNNWHFIGIVRVQNAQENWESDKQSNAMGYVMFSGSVMSCCGVEVLVSEGGSERSERVADVVHDLSESCTDHFCEAKRVSIDSRRNILCDIR